MITEKLTAMKLDKPVSQIMSDHIHTVDLDDPVQEARLLFEKFKVRHLPVISKGKLVGILSLTDIMRISFGDIYGVDQYDVDSSMYDMLTVNEVMKAKPHTVSSESAIKDVVDILIHEEFHALPVVEEDKLVGIVTTTDLINYLAYEEPRV